LPPSRTGWRRRGEKNSSAEAREAYLDRALEGFSGSIAIDEAYEPSCAIVSVVDNVLCRRLTCEVLPRKVTQAHVTDLLGRVRQTLEGRGLRVDGVCTDGSHLYPAALARVFPQATHQVCRFHAIAGVLLGAAKTARRLYRHYKRNLPRLGHGRPKRDQRERVQDLRRREERLADLYRKRQLLLRRELDEAQDKDLRELCEHYPLLKDLRELVVELYGLYQCPDRDAAMTKLRQLRERAKRHAESSSGAAAAAELLSALNGPTLEKSLVYLDHRHGPAPAAPMPATSNAVERSNRRFRKMQKGVYRVRQPHQIRRRLALDMLREQRAAQRKRAIELLHRLRAAT